MKTSQQWWDEVKANPEKTAAWLIKQWRGEVTAAFRIEKLARQYTEVDSREAKILNTIAAQEKQHAEWVKDLLVSRNIEVDETDIVEAEDRYWAQTLPGIKDFATGSAVAAHAEKMRLERIRAISEDVDSPEDIKATFSRILKDEVWHEEAFRKLSTPEAMEATEGDYKLGREALGLEA
jgi:rubrerythrin